MSENNRGIIVTVYLYPEQIDAIEAAVAIEKQLPKKQRRYDSRSELVRLAVEQLLASIESD